MPERSRREFFKSVAANAAGLSVGVLSAGASDLAANPLGMPIGCQTYPVRHMIAKDFPGTIKQLVGAGFQNLEMCSPLGLRARGIRGARQIQGI